MRHKRVVALAAAVAAAVAVLAAAPAGAQEDLAPLEISPASGPAGTVFIVSGDGCIGEAGPGDVLVTVFFTADEVVDEFGVTPEDDGTWSAEIFTDEPDLPPGVYDVTATCFVSPESEEVIVEYDFVEFEVTAPPKPPEPPKPPAPEPEPAAKPAAPVVAKPTFTG